MKSRRLFLSAWLAGLVSCGRDRNASDRTSDWQAFTERISLRQAADVEAAVRNAQQSDYAVIFVHVDWSLDMFFVGPTFIEFCEDYAAIRGLPAIGFHYIDCTSVTEGYSPLRNLEGWKELESKRGGGSLIHGGGEVVWLDHGRAIAVEPIKYDTTPGDLLIQTLSRFKSCA